MDFDRAHVTGAPARPQHHAVLQRQHLEPPIQLRPQVRNIGGRLRRSGALTWPDVKGDGAQHDNQEPNQQLWFASHLVDSFSYT
jgi:hypothetical protein